MPKPKNLQLEFKMSKCCVSCDQEKDVSEFAVQSLKKDGLQNRCKQCISADRKQKWKNDPQHREKLTKKVLEWYENNKQLCLARTKVYCKDYLKSPWNRIPQSLRKRLAEKTAFRSKVGMKAVELKIYFESLFLDGMNWDNYGKVWQIRLIRPINDFDLNDSGEVSKINHYTNLKPSFSPEFLKSQGLLKK